MDKRILIVDDDPLIVGLLERILGGDYVVDSVDSGEAALDAVKTFGPDLVLLDIVLPGIDGYETCRRIKAAPHGDLTQVMLVSSKASTQSRLAGYTAGADDFVVKPFDPKELQARVRIQFRLRGAMTALARARGKTEVENTDLERQVRERTAEVLAMHSVTVFALAKLAESRDPETGEHLERMRGYAQILAERLSEEGPYAEIIDERFLADLYLSTPLHDIGKVGIPDVILLKPGQLTPKEFAIMQRHALIGADALEAAAAHRTSGGFLRMAIDIARYHHERFDGSGYPMGLVGSAIPLPARIVALADVYDALTSVRVYKNAFDPEVAQSMIVEQAGKHFDPVIVEAFNDRKVSFLPVSRQAETAEGRNRKPAATVVFSGGA